MKKILSILLFAVSAFAQTPVPPKVPDFVLPTYVAGGVAYNQLAGFNLWVSAIVPVANSVGIYESTTTDLFPTLNTVAGKQVYTFNASVRQGVHKTLYSGSKTTLLLGADAGVALSQTTLTPAAGTITGFAGSFTATYTRQVAAHWGVMVPIRALYLPNLGWNPVLEFGLYWKP